MTPSSTHARPAAQVLRWQRWSPLDVYKLGCGIFLMLAPFLFHFIHHAGRIDIALSGVALTVLSLAALVLFAEWEEWLQLALGLWLLIAPWALGLLHTPFMHVSIATGVVVTYLALLEIFVVHAPSAFE